MSCKQWGLLLLLVFLSLFAETLPTILLLLYPSLAESKNATALEYTIVLGSFSAAVTLCSPFVGKLLYYSFITPKRLFIFSLIGGSMTVISFGFVDHIQDRTWFIGTCITMRFIEGAIFSVENVGTNALVSKCFPAKTKYLFGILEMLIPFSNLMGPLLGATLYNLGGFVLPFATVGSVLLISAIIMIPLSSDYHNEKKTPSNDNVLKKIKMTEILKQPTILGCIGTIFLSGVGITCTTSTLEPYLRKEFGSTQIETGLVISMSGFMTIISPVFAYWSSNKFLLKIIVFFGILLQLIGAVLLGPVSVYRSYAVVLGAVTLTGLGDTLITFPSFLLMLQESETMGYKNNSQAIAYITGFYTTAIHFCMMVGRPISGSLYDVFGYQTSQNFNIVILGSLLLIYWKIVQ